MAKLYPPVIEGTLPAFYKNQKNGTATIAVPFALNKANSIAEIAGIAIKIKTVQSNTLLVSLTSNSPMSDLEERVAHFLLSEEVLQRILEGQFLKIQIAFIDDGATIGYYSTVGVIKYTSKPDVEIQEAKYRAIADSIPSFRRTYTGHYSNSGDSSEKVYQYIFNLYDINSNLIQTSGWCLHNASEDIDLCESDDKFTFTTNLQNYKNYYIEYGVKTVNDLEIYSTRFLVTYLESIEADLKADLIATNDLTNGCVVLTLRPHELNYTSGDYYIARSSKDNNFEDWEDIKKIRFSHAQLLTEWAYQDFTVEQGKIYKYSLQQFNAYGAFSARICAEPVMADFEDMFLFDGEVQLKVRFNPKVTSFKIDRLEQKIDTIGSKYPFFFRNGRVEYREFPIAGLISYLADEDQLFLTNKELQVIDPTVQRRTSTLVDYQRVPIDTPYNPNETYYYTDLNATIVKYTYHSDIEWTTLIERGKLWTKNSDYHKNIDLSTQNWRTTQLVDYNFYAERKFKTTVLEWLGNGQPKLFRSPGEGNYLVRLMNISLSPEDKTSRMLHNFSCTAYEIAKYSYESLIQTNIISLEDKNLSTMCGYETVSFANLGGVYKHGKINQKPIYGYLFVEGMHPGDFILYGDTEENAQKIVIGSTGSIKIEVGNEPLANVFISSEQTHFGAYLYNYTGQLTYRYFLNTSAQNSENAIFNAIEESALINKVKTYASQDVTTNILADLYCNTLKEKLFSIQFLSFEKKPVKKLFKQDNIYYLDSEHKNIVAHFDPTSIYLLDDQYFFSTDDGENLNGPIILNNTYTVNGETFTTSANIVFPKDDYQEIKVGNGFIAHVGYQIQYTSYFVENTTRMKVVADTYGKDSAIYLAALQSEIDNLVSRG